MPRSLYALAFLLLLPWWIQGCGKPAGDPPLPEPLRAAHEWDRIQFGGVSAVVYADSPEAQVSPTRIWVYFPGATPSNPATSRLDLSLHLEKSLEPLPGSEPADTALVLGAPVESPLQFDAENYLYEGLVVPYLAGLWTLEFHWRGPSLDARAYVPLTINSAEARRAVIPVGPLDHLVVLAWVEPPAPFPGSQEYRLMAWRAITSVLTFDVDSTLTVLLTLPDPANPEGPPDTSRATWDGSHYSGTITLPDFESLDIGAEVFQDTSVVGAGQFTFE